MKRYGVKGMLLCMSVAIHAEHTNFGKTHFIIGQPTVQIPSGTQAAQMQQEKTDPVSLSTHSCVLFSPDDDVRKALCTLIDREKEAIKIAVFMFTDKEIAQALAAAQKRGVFVEMVTDSGCLRERYNKVGMLCDAGCSVFVYNPSHKGADMSSLMHHKFAIFRKNDGVSKIWTGSFNFTKAGREVNQENAIVLSDKIVVDQFEAQFQKLKKRSHRYGSEKIEREVKL